MTRKVVIPKLVVDGKLHTMTNGYFYSAMVIRSGIQLDLYQTNGDKLVLKRRSTFSL